VVDPKSAPLMEGSVLDYSEDLQKGGLGTGGRSVFVCFCRSRAVCALCSLSTILERESTVRLT